MKKKQPKQKPRPHKKFVLRFYEDYADEAQLWDFLHEHSAQQKHTIRATVINVLKDWKEQWKKISR